MMLYNQPRPNPYYVQQYPVQVSDVPQQAHVRQSAPREKKGTMPPPGKGRHQFADPAAPSPQYQMGRHVPTQQQFATMRAAVNVDLMRPDGVPSEKAVAATAKAAADMAVAHAQAKASAQMKGHIESNNPQLPTENPRQHAPDVMSEQIIPGMSPRLSQGSAASAQSIGVDTQRMLEQPAVDVPASSVSSAQTAQSVPEQAVVRDVPHGQLSPAQLFMDMKAMINVQKKTEQSSRGQPQPETPHKKPDVAVQHVPGASSGAPNVPVSSIAMSSAPMSAVSAPHIPVSHVQTPHVPIPNGPVSSFPVPHAPPVNHAHGSAVSQTSVPASHFVPPPHSRFDVDSATYRLAGTKIGAGERAALSKRQYQSSIHVDEAAIMRSAPKDVEVGAPHLSLGPDASVADVLQSMPVATDDGENGKRTRKQRADDIDKVLNSAGASAALNNAHAMASNQGLSFDMVKPGNGRISASVSRSFSFLMKTGGPFASRENSMEFRRSQFNAGKREMSIDMMRRDISMDMMCSKKMGSHELLLDAEAAIPRDMSIDFLGNALKNTNRDFSMEMQFPQDARVSPRGASLELGTFADEFGFALPGSQHTREEQATMDLRGSAPDSRLMRSRFGPSTDDLMVHMMGNPQPAPLYRRGINGSIEDFRDLNHPF